jgi:hypothetical protein
MAKKKEYERVFVEVTPALKRKVKRDAKRRGLTIAAYVRRTLMGMEKPAAEQEVEI